MTMPNWVQWIAASLSAGCAISVFMFTTFITKAENEYVHARVTKTNDRITRIEEKIDHKLEIIDEKLTRVLRK